VQELKSLCNVREIIEDFQVGCRVKNTVAQQPVQVGCLHLYGEWNVVFNQFKRRPKMSITLEEAKKLKPGTVLNHSNAEKNADGTPARFKVTSVKTWKRNPDRIEVHLKRGLYEHYTWTEASFDYGEITLDGESEVKR
jgi:hypothetical protein